MPRTRSLPWVTALLEYGERFHKPEQEKLRKPYEAFIPARSQLLTALVLLHGAFAAAMQRRSLQKVATWDRDATLIETQKKAVLSWYRPCA